MSFLDLQNEFYRPLWIRVLLLIILFSWSIFEFYAGASIWGFVFAGLGFVALYQWFLDDWPPQSGVEKQQGNTESELK